VDAFRRCRGLALNPDRGGALLEIAGLIDDQHRFIVLQLLDDEAAEVVADCIGIPPGPGQQMLQAVPVALPAYSASEQQFSRGRSDNRPRTNSRARRRGSTRANRGTMRPIKDSNLSCQRAGSML
jgi:hypothetical protein